MRNTISFHESRLVLFIVNNIDVKPLLHQISCNSVHMCAYTHAFIFVHMFWEFGCTAISTLDFKTGQYVQIHFRVGVYHKLDQTLGPPSPNNWLGIVLATFYFYTIWQK